MWGLLISGLLMGLTFYGAFVAPYSLMEHGERRRQSVGTLTGFSNEGAYLFIAGMILLFVAYALGYLALLRLPAELPRVTRRGLLAMIALGGGLFSALLLALYPVDASDIYDYIMRGRMSALYGLNPLEDVPMQVAFDDFYRYASWRRTPSAYGPLWEILAHGVTAFTSEMSRNAQVIAYKLLVVAGYGLTGLFIGLTLARIAPRRLLLGSYLFLWNPLVLYMTAGTGHNDALMTACVAFAIYALSRRWYGVATLGAVLGVLIKFIPALLLPFIALLAWRDLGPRRWLRYALTAGLVCGGLTLLLYVPYWHGFDTLRTSRRAVMYTGSVATVLRHLLMPITDGISDLSTSARQTPNASGLLANGTLVIFGAVYLVELFKVWRERQLMPALRSFARVIVAYLLVASLWFHAWYVVWLLAIVALLENTPTRRLALTFSYLVTWQAFLINYFDFETKAGERLPWMDVLPVTLYMGYAWAFVLLYPVRRRLWRADPADALIGGRIRASREAAGLSVSQLSDEMAMPYDDLLQIERGTRSLKLREGRRLAQRLDASLPAWLGVKA